MSACKCRVYCGDDGDIDGPGCCKGLKREPEPGLVEVILVPRSSVSGYPIRDIRPTSAFNGRTARGRARRS